MSFKPINSAHAIAEMIIHFSFSPQFSAETLEKFPALKTELGEFFSASHELHNFSFKLEAGSRVTPEASQGAAGIRLEKINSAGFMEWLAYATPDTIAVHCMTYLRWDSVWHQAKEVLTKFLDKIAGTTSLPNAFGLRYIDKFEYVGDETGYQITDLIKPNCPYLAQKVYNAEERWHSSTGWIEKDAQKRECLNQLNVDSSRVLIAGVPKLVCTIDHGMTIFANQSPLNLKLEDGSFVDMTIKDLHSKNKELLSTVITEEMAAKINLAGGKNVGAS